MSHKASLSILGGMSIGPAGLALLGCGSDRHDGTGAKPASGGPATVIDAANVTKSVADFGDYRQADYRVSGQTRFTGSTAVATVVPASKLQVKLTVNGVPFTTVPACVK